MIEPASQERMQALFHQLSNRIRLGIVLFLLEGPANVTQIHEQVGCSQSAASHQLAKLKAANLVKAKAQGKEKHYRLADDHVRDVIKIALAHVRHD